jgi:hypothetical protein
MLSLLPHIFSDIDILMPMYPEFRNRSMEDIPQEEYSAAMDGFAM